MKHETLQRGRALAERIAALSKELTCLSQTSEEETYGTARKPGESIPIASRIINAVQCGLLSADAQGQVYDLMLKDLAAQLEACRQQFEAL